MIRSFIIAVAAMIAMTTASAATWFVNGIQVGNVCRSGGYYFIYPTYKAQPVGSPCGFFNMYGVYMYGYVSGE